MTTDSVNFSRPTDEVSIATTPFDPPIPYFEPYWIATEASLIVITIFALYLVACLARYGMLTRCKPGREINGNRGRLLYQLCLISAVMAIGRFISDHTVALIGWRSDPKCAATVSASTVFYALSLYPVYLFLWLRQSIFYSNPVLSHVLNPVIKWFSWSILAVMLTAGTILSILAVIPEVTGWLYKATERGCEDVAADFEFDVTSTLIAALSVFFQVCLLALFMYPLLSKKTMSYRGGAGSDKSTHHGSGHASISDNVDPNNEILSEVSSSVANGHVGENSEDTSQSKKAKESYASSNLSNEVAIPTQSESNGRALDSDSKNGSIATVQAKSSNVFYRKKPNLSKNVSTKTNVIGLKFSAPLTFRNLIKTKNNTRKKSPISSSNRSRTKQGRRVMQFIRKAFILTLICCISDIFFAIIDQLIILPELVYLVLFDINLLINIICITMSFRDWPEMIFPVCTRLRRRNSTKHKDQPLRTVQSKLSAVAHRSRLDTNNQNYSPSHTGNY